MACIRDEVLCIINHNCTTQYAAVLIMECIVAPRDSPDHAIFRGKSAKLTCADKLGIFLSLTLYKNVSVIHQAEVTKKKLYLEKFYDFFP